MIGKVLRGTDVRRLLYYLYGPGKANEHTDPHLVTGFCDPEQLEPGRGADGSRDFRRLAGLLDQPLAALAGPGYHQPVWHCSVRAAPEDRMLSDGEWAQVAAGVMNRTGLAPEDDDLSVRWVAVRHGADHVHIVATLARQDGTRPRIWNDFFGVRQACQDAEARFGLRATAPADRTAARRPSRAEAEQAARRGWAEPPRDSLRRQVCTAAAGARTEQEFFTRLGQAGVAVRRRYSTICPGAVTGYAVGLPAHTAKDGGIVWYGGGKLAADLTLPRLRCRWAGPGQSTAALPGCGLPAAAARAVLRNAVTGAARQARDEAGFFERLDQAGVQVRLRFSDTCPGQVTGYAVSLAGHTGRDGAPVWYGGGRLAAGLALPRLRARWAAGPDAGAERSGAFRCSGPEQNAIFQHAARQARAAAEHIRRCARADPAAAADAAWAAADTLHAAAQATGSPHLRAAADSYDRAARAPHGRIPPATGAGNQLRAAARLMALTGQATSTSTLIIIALATSLLALAAAVAEMRQAQHHQAQAAAARATTSGLGSARAPDQLGESRPGWAPTAAHLAGNDFPSTPVPGRFFPAADDPPRRRPGRGRQPPPRRAGPSAPPSRARPR